MKKWIVRAGILMMLVGCGDEGGLSPDAVKSSFNTPTGIVSEENASEIVDSALEFYFTNDLFVFVGIGGPTLSPQQIGGSYDWCEGGMCCSITSEHISCDCPEGGSITARIGDCESTSTPIPADALSWDYSMSNCGAESCTVDGSGFIEVGYDPYYNICEGGYYYIQQWYGEDIIKYFITGFDGKIECPQGSFSGRYAIMIDFTDSTFWIMVEIDGAVYWVDVTGRSDGSWTARVRGSNGIATCEMSGDTVVSCSM